ncbi:MAG: DUF2239 family protein [Gemmatimonadaceae bacterium]
MPDFTTTYTAFLGDLRIAHGPLADVAVAVKNAESDPGAPPVLIFDDITGRQLDVDTRGTDDEIRARYSTAAEKPRGRGRPKLGVVPREVTLLPRHWDWLTRQPGGASAALRRLVDAARRENGADSRANTRAVQEAAYAFMHAIAGNYPGYEEATRALFANDRVRFTEQIAHWPHDVRAHALWLSNTSRIAEQES